MEAHIWPLYGLRVTTPRLQLRLPTLELLEELSTVAAGGLHDEDYMPFSAPWSATSPAGRARTTFQHVLGTVAQWQPDAWTLSLAVLCDGAVVGRQDIMARAFGVTREAETGSWLGLPYQGRGIGTEMRAAVLHLAFAVLGATCMTSVAMTDNAGSLGVSRKLGYRPDGLCVAAVDGVPRTQRRLRLERADWQTNRTIPVEVTGFEPCRDLFGPTAARNAPAP
ncbi:GNAT family protein [Streptomyces sp. SL13]|uniref:GNAT family protein n=1 Tax=Streptantibioticus silvisoli TaxID=2705255 RepID=A0AA90KB28_9ACTN|nr:GNAT family protein [Streptantibioticus silvisoli]MDI5972777.1 GNAT family protein [Streptantibioticus silvisoli]